LFRLPTPTGKFDEVFSDALVQPDGKLVVVGTRSDYRLGTPPPNSVEILIMRVSNVVPTEEVFANGFE
jgi:hypothetical protein